MKRVIAVAMLLLMQIGCVTVGDLRFSSAGSIGCSPDKIAISNYATNYGQWYTRTWVATCNGKSYACTLVRNETKCTEKKD